MLTAAKFMYGGAAVSTVYLIATLPFIGDIHGTWNGYPLTATPLTITVVIVVFGLVPIAVWLCMTRAASRQELGARLVHGAVRPGDAAADR